MTTTTDYDAPRRSSIEDVQIESLDALTTARAEAQSPTVDLDDSDAGESLELPGADLSGEELTMVVVPKRVDEFTYTSASWSTTAAASPRPPAGRRSAPTAPESPPPVAGHRPPGTAYR